MTCVARHHLLQRLADQLGCGVAEQSFARGIDREDRACFVYGDDGVGRALGEHAIELTGVERREGGHPRGRALK